MFLFFFCRNLYGPHICLWGFFTFLVDLAHGAEEGEGIALSQVTPYIITSVSTPFALRPVHVLWTWSIPNLSKHDLTEQVDYILLSLELTIYPSPLQHLPHTSNKIFTKQTHQDFSNPLLCRLWQTDFLWGSNATGFTLGPNKIHMKSNSTLVFSWDIFKTISVMSTLLDILKHSFVKILIVVSISIC